MSEQTESVAKKARKKRAGIVAGVVVAVVIVAGVGFGVWHNQPSFCSAICHTPMDAYLETYEGTQDKYGNELERSEALGMAAFLHNKLGKTCLDCHEPTMSEQVSEGINWVTGNYVIVGENKMGQNILPSRNLDELVEAQGLESGDAFCLKSGCHVNADGSVMTREDLIEVTSSYERNPHTEPHGTVACSDCHKAHYQSTNICRECHTDAELPTGWVTPSEMKQIKAMTN